MNKNPKSEDILKVIRVFEKVLPLAKREENLCMMATRINHAQCGTVCCHAGWYLFGKRGDSDQSFSNGIELMSQDLYLDNKIYNCGFSGIEEWAKNNPELWGNKFGNGMFSSMWAFKSEANPEGAKTLQHIVDHWKEVYERVKATEQPEPKIEKPKEIIRYVTVSASLKRQIPELIQN